MATITQWNFNSNPADANPSTGTTTPSIGTGLFSLVGTTNTFASGDANGGSSDPVTGDDSGLNTTGFPTQSTGDKTEGVQFNVSTLGKQNITVSFDQRHSNTSSRFVQFQYTIDGINFIDFGSLFEATAGDTWFNNRSVNLTGVTGVDNNANFGFRLVAAFAPSTTTYSATNSGSSYSSAGTWRFDSVTVAGIDIPSTPIVDLSVSSNAGSEAGTTLITVTATASSAVNGDQTVDLAIAGTGITSGDYNLSNTSISILNGQTTGSVTFTIVDDTFSEGTETAILSISNPTSGISLGTTTSQNIAITDNEPTVFISEVNPSGSGNGTYGADWFEVTNIGTTDLDITGWKIDDNSNAFGSSVALRGLTTIAAGKSAVFLEGNATGTTDATIIAAFSNAWFGSTTPPSNLIFGFYGGSGVGLGNGGDAVNLFNASGTRITGVSFGAATTNVSFDNKAGSTTTVATLSTVGVNGAFLSSNGAETGSPGNIPFAPVTNAPTIGIDTTSTTNFLDGGTLNLLSVSGSGAVSGVIDDPTDPAKTLGIDFAIADSDTAVGNLTVTVSSSNQSVVTNANLTLTGTGANRNLKINPVGVGFANITVAVSDGTNTTNYVINYGASAASVNPTTTRFLTGTSDASSAIAIDANYMFVADDEDQTIRLYDRQNSGLPVAAFDFTSSLGLSGSSEVDIEASSKVGNTIYWLGSHSNNSTGSDRPNRERIFSTTVSGTEASSNLAFGGYYQFLEDDLIAWDNNNGHGLGAGFLGLAASAGNGVLPEQTNGFNIEGLTFAPDGTTAYVSFRAPTEPTSSRDKALIIPVTNFTSILNGSGGSAGSASFAAPIFLDLGGRGIRSIERNANNEYLIIAGPSGSATGTAPNDFRLYTWTGNSSDAPVLRLADLTGLSTNGSFESIVEVPNSLNSSTQIEVLVDNGDTIYYNDGQISKDLAQTNQQKFRKELIQLGAAGGITKISAVQGTGAAATAGTFTFEGIVVGDFQGTNQLGGFYLQEENSDADGNVLTSEGIFVNSLTAVNVGDKVQVTGTVAENSSTPSFNQAVITPTNLTVVATGQQALVSPTVVNLPTVTLGDLERYEGMLITFNQALTVTEVFNLGRFGEISLAANGRLITPTNVIDPNDILASGNSSTGSTNVAAVTALQDLNDRSRIILDDGSSASNLSDVPYIDTTDANPLNDTLRIGSTINSLTGVLGFGFNEYRIQATQAPTINYEPRPTLPNVGGSIKVGSFNVLNYFNGDGLGGGFPTSRGADTAVEFGRQRAKIIAAIKELNADVVGLIEMENDGDGANSAIADLVNGLNAAIGSTTYSFIPLSNTTGSSGTDEIKVALIYKPGSVTPFGNATYFNDPAFSSARPPLAQTFTDNVTGEKFTSIINHFKSKGSVPSGGLALAGDTDQGDGQGLSNATRKAQATALVNFVSQIQTSSGDSDVIVLGDLNAYTQEDPIDILRAGGLTKLVTSTDSYVFDGQTGSLDHALVTSSLLTQVTGAEEWNINSAEPTALDYNDNIQTTGTNGEQASELRNDTSLYQATPFRSSDHDPVLVGLNLSTPQPLQILGTANRDVLTGTSANEIIVGREGGDTLTGGGGNDIFKYNSISDTGDRITDFTVGDVFNLTTLFASFGQESLDFSNAVSQGFLSFQTSGVNSIIRIDQDGSSGNLFSPRPYIQVSNTNVNTLNNSNNFILSI